MCAQRNIRVQRTAKYVFDLLSDTILSRIQNGKTHTQLTDKSNNGNDSSEDTRTITKEEVLASIDNYIEMLCMDKV